MCVYVYVCVCVLVAQSCLTLCDPIDCSPPGSSVHGILQARILEWVAIPFSRRSSQARDWTQVNKHIFFFIFLSIMGYHRTLNTVPCAIQEDLVVYPFSIWSFASTNRVANLMLCAFYFFFFFLTWRPQSHRWAHPSRIPSLPSASVFGWVGLGGSDSTTITVP